jgi:Tol biopolymer transport system component
VIAEGARADIWVTDVQRGAATRLTHTGINLAPVWSADGRQVYFASRGSGPFELWSRPADGSQPARRLVGAPGHVLPLAASPDGTTLAFRRTGDETRADIWALPLGGGTPHPLVQGPFDEHAASFSPDSRLLAFQSAETGRWEIYVRRLADGRRVVVSTDGGERPMWTRDGLYYQARGRLVRAVISDSGGSADLAVQHAPSPTDLPAGALRGIAPDGRLLLDGSTDFSQSIAVVGLEWLREVRSLLGPPASALPR